MVKAKVSGPLISRVTHELRLQNPGYSPRVEATMDDGDLYIHIHVGWKSFVVAGLFVANTVAVFVTEFWPHLRPSVSNVLDVAMRHGLWW